MILDNAEEKTDLILAKLESGDLFNEVGYDVLKRDYVNMIDNGIIDPTDVVVNEIQNASSVASLLLTTSSAIIEDDSEKDKTEVASVNPYGMM
jgi:chaperonin GroEL